MADKQVQFLPFHAINKFMRDDYRADVVREVLHALPKLPESDRNSLERSIKRDVRVPGFRNSVKAPAALKVKPTCEAFEKSPGLASAVLSAWADNHLELRQKVYDLLVKRDWEVLPLEGDRTRLPGFLTVWPAGEDFETLNEAFVKEYPQASENSDDISLMVVWISGRLPLHTEEKEHKEEA